MRPIGLLLNNLAMGRRGGGAKSPLLTGLISYWKLDEVTGTRVDSHGSNDMEPSGTVNYAPGKLGNALSQAIATPGYLYSSNAIQCPATGFTVWAWVQLFSITQRKGIAQSILLANYSLRWYLVHYAQNSWRFSVTDSVTGGSIAIDTTVSALNTWYFVCGRYNPTTKKAEIRVNAGAWGVGNDALANGPAQNAEQTDIGRYANSNTDGLTDSVGISGRYLSDEEVDRLYNGGDGLEYPF